MSPTEMPEIKTSGSPWVVEIWIWEILIKTLQMYRLYICNTWLWSQKILNNLIHKSLSPCPILSLSAHH
jgi:hypothetical protein